MLLAPLLGLLGCAPDEAGSAHGLPFVLPLADVGAPTAASTGFDPRDGDATGLALDQVLPVFGTEAALWEAPAFVWGLMMKETVQSQGQCPLESVVDDETVYDGACRSSFGYAFEGDVRERAWEADGVTYERFEADIVVIGDVDDPVFTRAALRGAVERAVPDDGRVDAHYDVNLRLELLGYWESRPGEAAKAAAWSAWEVSGTAEEHDGAWMVDLAADVNGAGGMQIVSERLAHSDACPVEQDGTATLGDGVTAVFAAASCDACGAVTHPDGETAACRMD